LIAFDQASIDILSRQTSLFLMSKQKPAARERILNTASQLFQAKGYTEVGINEIIAKSSTAKATFYSHFSSKELLGEAWLKLIHDQSVVYHHELLSQGGKPREILSEYFEQLQRFLVKGDYRGCPYTNTKAVVKSDEMLLDEQILQHKISVRKFFSSLAELSGLTVIASQELADQIFILYSGATAESQNLKEIWPVRVGLSTSLMIWDLAHTS